MEHPLNLRAVAAGLTLLAAAAPPGAVSAQAKFDSPVVSTAWLAEHLNDPTVVVLHLANVRRDLPRCQRRVKLHGMLTRELTVRVKG